MLSGYPLGQRIAMFTYRRARAGEETRQMAARGADELGRDDGISGPSARDQTVSAVRDEVDVTIEVLRRGCGAEGHRGDPLLRLCNRSN
jgi:hypothetical protein